MKKRLFAILLAAIMLVSLFSACSSDGGSSDGGSGSGSSGAPVITAGNVQNGSTPVDNTESNTAHTGGSSSSSGSDSKEEDKTENTPSEVDALRLSYMGRESHQWTYTLEEAIQKGFESYDYYLQKMLDTVNLVVDITSIDNEAYKTTLTGYLASNTLLDTFISQSMMDDDMLVNTIQAGRFADIDEIIANSPDGNFATLTSDGQVMNYLKAWSTAPDGHWYMVKNTDNQAVYLNFDDADTDYVTNFGIANWYSVNIRRDWLDKVGLAMPTTTAEFKDALVAFQQQDVNGNGAADERAFLGFGLSDGIGTVFSNGVAGWFGLHRDNFVMDTTNGAVVSAVEDPGYPEYITYAKELYDNKVALMGEGMAYQHAVNAGGNYCSAHPQYPDTMMTVATGDDNSEYEPMPIIQAIEGIDPVLLGQASVSSMRAISFSTNCDYAAAAAWLDWIFSPELFMVWSYGIEGKAWEWKDDGSIYRYRIGEELTEEEEERYGDMWCYAPWCLFPQFNTAIYSPTAASYNSMQEALDAGEPYRGNMLTFDEWKSQYENYNWRDYSPQERLMRLLVDYGTENMRFDVTVNFETIATNEEADVINQYRADLLLYLNELTTSYITGTKTLDTYESDIQFAYDNLGMLEYASVIQDRINRYLTVMGREAITLG